MRPTARKKITCVFALAIATPISWAQEIPPPRIEWFGGYSADSVDSRGIVPIGSSSGSRKFFEQGAVFSFDFNASRRWRLVLGEVAWQRHDANFNPQLYPQLQPLITGSYSWFNQYQFLFGPEFKMRHRRYTAFAHGLAGWGFRHLATPSGDLGHLRSVILNDHGAAFAAGGGLEVSLARHWSYRIGQIDYVPQHRNRDLFSIANPLFPPLPSWQHDVRFQTGIIFRFAEKP